MKKIKIGIDIDEILRAKWLKFDKCYVEEFGDENVPQDAPYVYDFFKEYPWEDIIKEEKFLKEDLPDDINPIDYEVDPETGEAPVDFLAFSGTTTEMKAKEVYNHFMYEDYLLEIHGAAPVMYRNMEVDVEKFFMKYSEVVDFVVLANENWFSIPPTLFFLSKMMSRFKEYRFVDNVEEMWDGIDILITTNPEVFENGIPDGKVEKHAIKLHRPYNTQHTGAINKEILQLNDLNGNEEFEKLINYTKKEENE